MGLPFEWDTTVGWVTGILELAMATVPVDMLGMICSSLVMVEEEVGEVGEGVTETAVVEMEEDQMVVDPLEAEGQMEEEVEDSAEEVGVVPA